jgi:hypothetical protein
MEKEIFIEFDDRGKWKLARGICKAKDLRRKING